MYLRELWSISSSALALILAWTLSGCGGTPSNDPHSNPPPTPNAEFLYATSAAQAMPFTLNPSTGTLTARTATPVFASLGITATITADPASKFLLVPDLSNSSINVFSINATTGSVTAVSGSPFSVGSIGAGCVAIDPAGKYLYAADASGVKAFAFNDATGALAAHKLRT